MIRDFERPTSKRYDLLVVGGGIHGLFAAYDAAVRGLSVVLIDRADFGSGLTANHQRTIHGGLRMLERGRLLKARRDLIERRTWARIAPHFLRPLPFLVATYRWTKRSRWALKAGFAVYDALGRHRNAGVPAELHLPKPRLESVAATRRLFPGVAERGLSGGAVWYDYQTRHPDRLTWTVALAAKQAGAALMNYVEAIEPLRQNDRISGARVIDRVTGDSHVIDASVVLIAAGSGMPQILQKFGVDEATPFLHAINLLLNRPARDIATVAASPKGRMLTAVPWNGHLLVGTMQSDSPVSPDDRGLSQDLLSDALAEANATFPRIKASMSDVRFVHHGLVPAVVTASRADLLPQPRINRHATGLVSLTGVKFTSARAVAEDAVNVVVRELPQRPALKRSQTALRPLPHAGVADVEGRLVETTRELGIKLDRDVVDHLTQWYGTEASDVLRHSVASGLVDRLTTGVPILMGEIDYAVAQSQALHLADVVLRRTPLGSAGHPGEGALERAATMMAKKLGWSSDQITREIADVAAIYPPK